MADGIYISMCGAAARTEQLDSISDNLANAQTPGFKAGRPAFEAFLAPSGSVDKQYVGAVATALDLRPGPSVTTGNPFDVLPEGDAFLTVRTASGEAAYTRDGRLTLDSDGQLVTASSGRAVLDRSGQPILVPSTMTGRVEANGEIWGRDEFGRESKLGELGLARLEGPVDRIGPSLLTPSGDGQAVPVESRVRTGTVELGNAGALEAAVSLVAAQRSYDTSIQALQTYRQLDQRAAELGRIK